jgi:hypothetical protein
MCHDIPAQALARQLLSRGKDVKILSDELSNVVSTKLKISWQEAVDQLGQVSGGGVWPGGRGGGWGVIFLK